MRHSLHNSTLTWRLFSLDCFLVATTTHTVDFDLKSTASLMQNITCACRCSYSFVNANDQNICNNITNTQTLQPFFLSCWLKFILFLFSITSMNKQTQRKQQYTGNQQYKHSCSICWVFKISIGPVSQSGSCWMEQNNSEEATPGPTPGELHSSSINTPPMDICLWSSSATGRGNNIVSPSPWVIEKWVIRFEKVAK